MSTVKTEMWMTGLQKELVQWNVKVSAKAAWTIMPRRQSGGHGGAAGGQAEGADHH